MRYLNQLESVANSQIMRKAGWLVSWSLATVGLLLLFLISSPVYADEPVTLNPLASWFSGDNNNTFSVAWGDVDADGDLDLAVGNEFGPNKVYLNEGGVLQTAADNPWSSGDYDDSWSVAWGDVDGDGDLDLAVGNDGVPNKVYLNEGGVLQTTAPWTSSDSDETRSVAWGDVDGDGDLDLAIGNRGAPNKVYLNEGGVLQTITTWTSGDNDDTFSVAWGDVDDDGDLDLAAGNSYGENKVYLNEGGVLQTAATWTSGDYDNTWSVAWGDIDGDGDLDLAAGNNGEYPGVGEVNKVYLNEGGMLQTASDNPWSSGDYDYTRSVAWGDVDDDGDLDLATGNWYGSSRVYLNEGGVLQTTADNPWSTGDSGLTFSVAWGDVDGDGDLDLATGNTFGENKLYLNDGRLLQTAADNPWSSGDYDDTRSVAWGDVDDDGDLDLAAGNSGDENKIYLNEGGMLQTAADNPWSSGDYDYTRSVAWGDVDGDGDLDLAIGNKYGPNKVYLNEGGVLQIAADNPWSSGDSDDTRSVAWGDVDGDGDLDLAAGNEGGANKVYLNEGGVLQTPAVWASSDSDYTYSVAWGDVDGDGDLDLAAGNWFGSNKIYLNEGGVLQTTAAWSSGDHDATFSIAWGDVDGDGDLDLAVGNAGSLNKVYLNEGGVLQTASDNPWSSGDNDPTRSVAWGDVDGDGDLDLAFGNWTLYGENKVYLNEGGVLQTATDNPWSSGDTDDTCSVAWGDVDGDGDLDLAVGNDGQPNRLYRNMRRSSAPLVNNPSYLAIPRPGATDDAYFFSTPYIIQASNVPITYTLFDPEGNIVSRIFPEFSPNGGGQWFPATPATGAVTTNLAASPWPTGTTHTFIWNAEADLIKSDNVVFRIRAQPGYSHSPIPWPAVDGKSPPFRVEAAPWYAKVVSQDGNAVEGAIVYYDGQLVTTDGINPRLTDRAGLLKLDGPTPGKPLVALAQTHEKGTIRAAHDGWAYRTYLTNLNLDDAGTPHPFVVSQPGEQRLIVRRDNPLVLFNLVVSIEWDADESYLTTIADAFRKASDYLYDITDGQMAFGQVSIYDNGEYWADADYQFSTKNTVRPYAFVGGLTSNDEAHTIRVGRFWDGGSGNRGNWNEPNGYRTLIHELGHYALSLYDEYFIRHVDGNGHFIGELPAACTSDSVWENSSDATNASIMFYQYNASELAGMDRWTEDCQNTEQQRINGQADWQTVLAYYGGADWTLNTPTSRGSVMAGPDQFPDQLLPFPIIEVDNAGPGGTPCQVTVLDPQGQLVHNALVALYTSRDGVTIAIDQGLTDARGKITVYGAAPGDTIRAATFDGAYAGAIAVGSETSYQLTLSQVGGGGLSAQDTGQVPYLSVTPQSDGDGLYLQVAGLEPDSPALDAIVVPGEGGGSPQWAALVYSPIEEAHVGTVSLSGVGLGTGRVKVIGESLPNNSIHSDYNLQWVDASEMNDLYSEDGNFELHLPPDSLLADAYATVLPTGYVPGPLPGGRQVMGSAYDVRLSGAVTELAKAGMLKLHYHPGVMGVYTDTVIYHWSAAEGEWQEVGGEPSEVDNALSTTVTKLGIYALMGKQVEVPNGIYLPIILKESD